MKRLTDSFIDHVALLMIEGKIAGSPPPVREVRKPRTDEFFDDWFIRQDFDGTNDAMAQWDIERPNGISILRHPGEV